MTIDKKTLLKLAGDPRFIAGIYNYCDRWCERCAFTRRCFLFAQEQGYDQESRDISNKKFWDRIHESFGLTRELVEDFAKENNIDLTAIDPGDVERRDKEREKKNRENPLAKSSWKYIEKVNDWFKQNEELFKEKGVELTKHFELGIDEPEETAAELIDAVEVIRWYQHQIHVKLMRALDGEEWDRNFEDDEEMKEFPKDSDGSAKVALVGIDRSIGAWGRLQNDLPGHQESVNGILILLERMRKNTENDFPNARTFVRPGFDQEA